jgi:hypothetical protein
MGPRVTCVVIQKPSHSTTPCELEFQRLLITEYASTCVLVALLCWKYETIPFQAIRIRKLHLHETNSIVQGRKLPEVFVTKGNK